jgi:hypothetical protein
MAIDVQWQQQLQPLLDDGSNLAERSSMDSSTMYLESIQNASTKPYRKPNERDLKETQNRGDNDEPQQCRMANEISKTTCQLFEPKIPTFFLFLWIKTSIT